MSYSEHVAEAIASQDYRSMTKLLIDMAGKIDAAEAAEIAASERRHRRAEQKREERRRLSLNVARQSATDRDLPLPPAPSLLSPTPPNNTSSSPIPLEHSEPREALREPTEPTQPAEPVESVEPVVTDIGTAEALALSLSTALGERVSDVRRFMATRRRETWPAWMRQMLKLIGPGSPNTADDLAEACNDALALEEPIAGPHALRAFVAKRRAERHEATTKGTGSFGATGAITPRYDPIAAKAARDRELRDERFRRSDEEAYNAQRKSAVEAWRSGHADRAREIAAEIERKLTGTMPAGAKVPAWVESAIGGMVQQRWAAEAGFPDFETWRAKRRGAA